VRSDIITPQDLEHFTKCERCTVPVRNEENFQQKIILFPEKFLREKVSSLHYTFFIAKYNNLCNNR